MAESIYRIGIIADDIETPSPCLLAGLVHIPFGVQSENKTFLGDP